MADSPVPDEGKEEVELVDVCGDCTNWRASFESAATSLSTLQRVIKVDVLTACACRVHDTLRPSSILPLYTTNSTPHTYTCTCTRTRTHTHTLDVAYTTSSPAKSYVFLIFTIFGSSFGFCCCKTRYIQYMYDDKSGRRWREGRTCTCSCKCKICT